MDYTDIKIKLYVKMKSNTKMESALQFLLHMSHMDQHTEERKLVVKSPKSTP